MPTHTLPPHRHPLPSPRPLQLGFIARFLEWYEERLARDDVGSAKDFLAFGMLELAQLLLQGEGVTLTAMGKAQVRT